MKPLKASCIATAIFCYGIALSEIDAEGFYFLIAMLAGSVNLFFGLVQWRWER